MNSSRSQERALLGLGYVQVETNQPAAAVQTLEKGVADEHRFGAWTFAAGQRVCTVA